MNAQEIKDFVFENDKVKDILDAIGCGNVRNRGNYVSASNPDGNNPQAIIVYLNSNLTCIDYTRQLVKTPRTTDIFDLVAFFEDCSFPEALKFCCNTLGLDYYNEPEDLPESLQLLKMLKAMAIGSEEEEDDYLKPIPEEVLGYYLPYPNSMFEKDGIDYDIQKEFEISYDPRSNYIAIPIRDSIGTLCGVKGRYFGESDEYHSRYLYLEKCNKSKILYGYWQNREYIKNSSILYIVESEKSVGQLATLGIRNAVSTGGKTISKTQVELITRTGCTPILALDEDVHLEELQHIASMFMDGIPVKAIIDTDNILESKESPSDNPSKWFHLVKNNIYDLRQEE